MATPLTSPLKGRARFEVKEIPVDPGSGKLEQEPDRPIAIPVEAFTPLVLVSLQMVAKVKFLAAKTYFITHFTMNVTSEVKWWCCEVVVFYRTRAWMHVCKVVVKWW